MNITFPDEKSRYITCTSMNGVKVKIGPLTGVIPGNLLTITLLGYSDRAGLVPIPGTQISLSHTITPSETGNSVEKVIGTWPQNIKPIGDGSVLIGFTINGVGNNVLVPVKLSNTAGQWCDEV
ncbi:hypothetical protein M5G22_00895 [Pseudomonas sp. TNT2022 ID233]|jgi:hypothetical protein|uniref:hypothetical protein n=1 Tax=Pseudomonas aphyarum TaxID=2942629 RepID=UPI0023628846|nr:hypothetical protein [Pseudomonas aphyarum]MDD1136100.1 hypothetical protein [Pseudomonas aphyarum]